MSRGGYHITVYTINATKIAQEIGLGNRTNTILQSAFFRITGVIPVELAVEKKGGTAKLPIVSWRVPGRCPEVLRCQGSGRG